MHGEIYAYLESNMLRIGVGVYTHINRDYTDAGGREIETYEQFFFLQGLYTSRRYESVQSFFWFFLGLKSKQLARQLPQERSVQILFFGMPPHS